MSRACASLAVWLPPCLVVVAAIAGPASALSSVIAGEITQVLGNSLGVGVLPGDRFEGLYGHSDRRGTRHRGGGGGRAARKSTRSS
jgi:hypothetical protein